MLLIAIPIDNRYIWCKSNEKSLGAFGGIQASPTELESCLQPITSAKQILENHYREVQKTTPSTN